MIIGWEIDYDPINNIITVSKDMYQDSKGKEKVDGKILHNYIKNIYTTLWKEVCMELISMCAMNL